MKHTTVRHVAGHTLTQTSNGIVRVVSHDLTRLPRRFDIWPKFDTFWVPPMTSTQVTEFNARFLELCAGLIEFKVLDDWAAGWTGEEPGVGDPCYHIQVGAYGELLKKIGDEMFLPIHIKVIRFCSEEIARQGDSPERVWQLVDAWNEAYIDSFVMRFARVAVTEHQIKHWHFRAMKHMVRHGYRNVALTKSDGIGIGAPISEIPRLMTQLVNAQHDMLPAEFYKEFEEIHPFLDGNGRVGKIIYNYLLGTLDDPQLPPDYWK